MLRTLNYIANRLWLVLLVYVISLVLATFIFSNAEGKPLFESFWWACVTSLTVGYGDMYPVTIVGRFVGILFGHFWVFIIIPTIVANIVIRAIENKNEFTDHEQKQMMSHLEAILSRIEKGVQK